MHARRANCKNYMSSPDLCSKCPNSEYVAGEPVGKWRKANVALNGYAFIGGKALLVTLFLLYRRSPNLSEMVVAFMTIVLLLWNIGAWVSEV